MTKKKTVVIFEGTKGAGKTMLIGELQKRFPGAFVYGEDVTLAPVKHSNDKNSLFFHYENVICLMEKTDAKIFFLDRFHYTKWPVLEYQDNYFKEIEKSLVEKFETSLIFLKIDPEKILDRLICTEDYRKPTGWKLNYDGISIESESQKDTNRQSFFLGHHYQDTLVQKKTVIDVTDLPLHLDNLESYLQQVSDFILAR